MLPLLIEAARPFRRALAKADMKVGYPASDIVPVNNMAREFKQTDGLNFELAIKAEAEITAICPPMSSEPTDVAPLDGFGIVAEVVVGQLRGEVGRANLIWMVVARTRWASMAWSSWGSLVGG